MRPPSVIVLLSDDTADNADQTSSENSHTQKPFKNALDARIMTD